MNITRQIVRDKLLDYLNRRITLQQLVDWAEDAMMEGSFEPQDAALLTEIVARIGVADTRDFGLLWEDCYDLLSRLGFRVKAMAA